MCQQCRYDKDFFRASDFTALVSGELVRANPSDKVVCTKLKRSTDALFDKWAGEEIHLIDPPFFEVETDRALDQRHSGGES